MPVQFLGSLGFKTAAALNSESILKASRFSKYSRPPVTRTLKGGGGRGNEKQFELAGNSSYRGKLQRNCDQGKGNLVRVSGEFELSVFDYRGFTVTKKVLFLRNLLTCIRGDEAKPAH